MLTQVNKRGGSKLGYQTCYFDPLRSPGKPPLWWTSSITKMVGFLTKVTMVGFTIVTQELVILCWDLHNYKSSDNIFAPFPGRIQSFSSTSYLFVSFSQSLYLIRLPGNFTEGDPLTFLDDLRLII